MVVQQCREDLTAQRNKKKKAELSQEPLALLIYKALTPGQCKEYTTLTFEVHNDCLAPHGCKP